MRILMILACAVPLLAACGSDSSTQNAAAPQGAAGWFGGGSSDQDSIDAGNTSQLGVNSFLWRASLDTLHFMPLKSTDPIGGVIITDWYADPTDPNEQMKVTVYISDKRLRADAIKVSVFRQIRTASGWIDAQVNPDTGTRLENAILARARQLHLATAQQ